MKIYASKGNIRNNKDIKRPNVYSFKGRDFISPDDITKEELEYLVETGIRVKRDWNDPSKKEEQVNRLKGKRAMVMFLEPSSRTRESSITATLAQGGDFREFPAIEANSFVKGEPWRDAFEVMGRGHGFDYFVLRTKVEGAPKHAAQVLRRLCEKKDKIYTPVINGGDGRHWHPTQGVLDHQFAYTIFCPDGNWDGLHNKSIAYAGDLTNSRTVHTSMRNWMRYKGVEFFFVAVEGMRMPKDYLSMLDVEGIKYKEVDSFSKKLVSNLDLIYLARPQQERWQTGLTASQRVEYAKAMTLLRSYFPDKPSRSLCGRFFLPIINHALPRDKKFQELEEALIDTPFWGAFDQVEEGVYHRAGLFDLLLGVPGFGDELRKKRIQKTTEARITFESEEADPKQRKGDQVGPINNGFVLDHIADDYELVLNIKQLIPAPRAGMSSGRVVSPSLCKAEDVGYKWIIKIEDPSLGEVGDMHLVQMGTPALNRELAERLVMLDPEMVINIIKNGRVRYKVRASFPNYVKGRIPCSNDACISHPSQMENVTSVFKVEDKKTRRYRCDYCDTIVDLRSVGFYSKGI